MLKNTVAFALAAALLMPAAAMASTKLVLTDATKAKITTVLTEHGYQVGKIKVEDGMYEAYAKKDGKKLEVLLNGDFEILNTEMD